MKFIFRVLLSTVLFLSTSLFAATTHWTIIPNESTLSFTATQNNAPVTGEFKKFTGDIAFSEQDLAASSVDIKIDMNSLNTSYGELKDTLLAADWFNVKLFPTAVFKANKFIKKSEHQYEADGTLTIRDKTLPIILNFTLENTAPNKVIAKGTATINRTAFGVGQGEWASTKEIKDSVEVGFTIHANS
jgi:polyisoprenoid-binding protein YceI